MKVFLLFLFLAYNVIAQNYIDGRVIRSITINKPKRTKVSTIYSIIYPIKQGSKYYKNTISEIIDRLHKANIFTPDITVDEKIDGDYVDLTITVVDKWTLLGAPMFSFSSTSWFVGLAAFDMNLLGLGKKLFLFGRYGNRGWRANAVYNDPYFLSDRLKADISFYIGEDYTKDYNVVTKQYLRDYQNLYIKGVANYGFRVVEDVTLMFGLKYELNDNIKNKISEVFAMQTIGINYGFVWQNTKYSYPFTQGFKMTFEGSYNIALNTSSSNYFQGVTEVNYAYVFAKRNKIGFFLSAGLSDSPDQREFRLGGFEGTFILPNSIISADVYTSLFVFYELFVFDIKWKKKSLVAFSIQPFYEIGRFDNNLTTSIFYHGPGIGVIAYPSVVSGTTSSIGFRVGWDLENKDFNFIFSGSRSL